MHNTYIKLIHVYYACHQIHTCSTLLDVVSDDAYMFVTVWTCVFMPEPDDMAKFMYHNAKLVTVLSDRDGLRATTSPPHVGTTPAGGETSNPHPGVSRTNTDSLLLVNILILQKHIWFWETTAVFRCYMLHYVHQLRVLDYLLKKTPAIRND